MVHFDFTVKKVSEKPGTSNSEKEVAVSKKSEAVLEKQKQAVESNNKNKRYVQTQIHLIRTIMKHGLRFSGVIKL